MERPQGSSEPQSLISLNQTWGVAIDPGEEEPFILMRFSVEPGRGFSAQTYNSTAYTHTPVRHAKRVRSYPTAGELLTDIRDRLVRADQEAVRALLMTRTKEIEVEPRKEGRRHWL